MPGNLPGSVVVKAFEKPMACGEKPEKGSKPRFVTLAFDAKAGAPAAEAMVWGAKGPWGKVKVQATLVTLPAAPGPGGQVRVEGLTGEGTSVTGTLDFVLCEAIPPVVPPQAIFMPQELAFGEGDGRLVVKVGLPQGWEKTEDFMKRPTWVAPDKVTRYSVAATCAGGCDPGSWARNATDYGKQQVSAFVGTEGWITQVWKDESPRAGAWVARYGYGTGRIRTIRQDVLLWGPDWPSMALCHAETLDLFASWLDEAEKACLGLVRVP